MTLASAVIQVFSFLTVGMEIKFSNVFVWLLALAVVLKLGIFKYKKGDKQGSQSVGESKAISESHTEQKKVIVEQMQAEQPKKSEEGKEIKNEKQPTTLDKAVKISIMTGALILALSTAYYVGIFLPKKEATRIEEKKRAETRQSREDCLAEVEKKYAADTKNREAQLERTRKDSYLVPFSKSYDRDEAMQECFNKYPQ